MRKNQLLIGMLFLVVYSISMSSCDISKKYEKQEKEEIAAFLTANITIPFVKMPSGLYYYEEITGSGAGIEVGDTAFFRYNASYLNGELFSSNMSAAKDSLVYAVGVGDLIEGVDEALSYMKVGGTSLLVVPSFLAYGSSGYGFPAYTPIFYEIKLVGVKDMTP